LEDSIWEEKSFEEDFSCDNGCIVTLNANADFLKSDDGPFELRIAPSFGWQRIEGRSVRALDIRIPLPPVRDRDTYDSTERRKITLWMMQNPTSRLPNVEATLLLNPRFRNDFILL